MKRYGTALLTQCEPHEGDTQPWFSLEVSASKVECDKRFSNAELIYRGIGTLTVHAIDVCVAFDDADGEFVLYSMEPTIQVNINDTLAGLATD